MRRLESNAKGDFPQGTEWAFPTDNWIRAKSATLSIDGKTLFFGSWDTYVCECTMQQRNALYKFRSSNYYSCITICAH